LHDTGVNGDVRADEISQTLETSAAGITRCSRDLLYLSANAAYARFLGLPAAKSSGGESLR
jgi:hypothetical protein